MSVDTLLNIAAVALAAVAVTLAGAAAYFTYSNRKVIQSLPQDMAPAQEAMAQVVIEAERVALLLKEDAERLQQYKQALGRITSLEKANADLEYKLGISDGKVIYMTDVQFRTNGILESQLGTMNKQANVIVDQHDTIENLRKLVEELTARLPGVQ